MKLLRPHSFASPVGLFCSRPASWATLQTTEETIAAANLGVCARQYGARGMEKDLDANVTDGA